MGNDQGCRHQRKRNHRKTVKCDKLIFIDNDVGEYVWKTHVVGRLPFIEPEEPEIVFHCDKLWQDEDDGWSLCVQVNQVDLEKNELSDVEIIEI